jgi:hypothetical protein
MLRVGKQIDHPSDRSSLFGNRHSTSPLLLQNLVKVHGSFSASIGTAASRSKRTFRRITRQVQKTWTGFTLLASLRAGAVCESPFRVPCQYLKITGEYPMLKLSAALRLLLLAGGVTISLSACGGSGSASTAAAVSPAKAASWTNVSVRALDAAININWDVPAGSVPGSAGLTYNIYCSTSSADIKQDSNRVATRYLGQSFDHIDLTNGQRYYYVVTEVSAAGEGPASRPVSATPQQSPPATPYGLKVTALDSSVLLQVTGPTPASTTAAVSYNLYRSATRGSFSAGDRIATKLTFSAPYSDQGLSNGSTYYYLVTSVVDDKESTFSPAVAVRPQAEVAAVDTGAQLAAFASPTQVSAEPGNGFCTIKWHEVKPLNLTSADPAFGSPTPDYIVYWSDVPDVFSNIKGSIDDAAKTPDSNGNLSSKIGNLNNGTMYYLQVAAAVKGSDGKPLPGRFTLGPLLAVTPMPNTPSIPSGVSATQGPQQVMLSWNKDSSGAPNVTYNVYFSTTAAATPAELRARGIKINNPDSTQASFTHPVPSGTYYYVVTSVSSPVDVKEAQGESAPSSIVSVTL